MAAAATAPVISTNSAVRHTGVIVKPPGGGVKNRA